VIRTGATAIVTLLKACATMLTAMPPPRQRSQPKISV
jgi:hypothetical protein